MTRWPHGRIPRRCAGLALALGLSAGAAPAQTDPWQRLVAEADSVGPVTPRVAPTRWTACGPGVQAADSVQVSGGSGDFILSRRSLRTRGYFSSVDPPATGAGRFALRHILCDQERGYPLTFVLERDHRYFYLVFSIREPPSYAALAFRSASGAWRPFRWDAERRTFTAGPDPTPEAALPQGADAILLRRGGER